MEKYINKRTVVCKRDPWKGVCISRLFKETTNPTVWQLQDKT